MPGSFFTFDDKFKVEARLDDESTAPAPPKTAVVKNLRRVNSMILMC